MVPSSCMFPPLMPIVRLAELTRKCLELKFPVMLQLLIGAAMLPAGDNFAGWTATVPRDSHESPSGLPCASVMFAGIPSLD